MSGFSPPQFDEIPILNQEPSAYEMHPVNFLKVVGAQIRRFRTTLPGEYKSQEGFAKLLAAYRTGQISRSTVARLETGDPSIAFGSYVAAWDIMRVTGRIAQQFISETDQYDEGDNLFIANIKEALGSHINRAKQKQA